MSKPVRPRAQKPDKAAVLEAVRRMTTYVEERTLTRIRGYLGRGRLLAGLPVESLRAQWIDTYLAVRVLEDEDRDDELRDLETEFDLRGLVPPFSLVVAEAARFRERFQKEWRNRKPDPVVLERTERELDDLCDRLIAEDREAMRA